MQPDGGRGCQYCETGSRHHIVGGMVTATAALAGVLFNGQPISGCLTQRRNEHCKNCWQTQQCPTMAMAGMERLQWRISSKVQRRAIHVSPGRLLFQSSTPTRSTKDEEGIRLGLLPARTACWEDHRGSQPVERADGMAGTLADTKPAKSKGYGQQAAMTVWPGRFLPM